MAVLGCFAWRTGSAGAAAEPVTARFKGDWPGFTTGPAGDVAVVDELAYISLDDGGLLIMDVRQGAEPAVLGSIRFRGSGPVAVHGRWAFLGVSGLQVIDVSNPANPGLAAQYELGSVRSLAVSGRHIYVLSDTALTVLDAGNGSVPAPVASIPQDGEGRRLVVSGERGYIAGGETLQIYELQDPTHPVKAGAISWEDGPPILDVAVSGAAAYVLDESGLRVVDVSDAGTPRQLSLVNFAEPLRGLRPSIGMAGAYAYVGSYGALSVFDVSDLMAPQEVSRLEIPLADWGLVTGSLGGIRGVRPAGNRLMLARDHDGVEILSLADPAHPVRERVLRTHYDVRAVRATGNDLYILNFPFGLQKLDLSAPDRPVLRGTHPCELLSYEHAAIEAEGAHVYLLSPRLGLSVLDFSDPTAPGALLLQPGSLATTASAMFRRGRSLLVANYAQDSDWYEVRSYSLTNPAAPSYEWGSGIDGMRTQLACSPESVRLRHRPGPLYWASPGGLFRFDRDLSVFKKTFDRGSELAGSRTPLDECHEFIVGNDQFAWLGGDGVTCVEISDADHPRNLGRVHEGPVFGMASGSNVVVVTGPDGLELLDVSVSGTAVVRAAYEAGGFGDVCLAGNYAVAARGREGLVVLDLGAAGKSAPRILRQPEPRLVLVGGTATFEVVAEGALPLLYQWRVNGVEIAGATSPRLNLTDISPAQNGPVQVTVRNEVGRVDSSNALLRVDIPPEITILSPEPGFVYPVGGYAVVRVIVQDPDGQPPVPEYFANGVKLGESGFPGGLSPPTYFFFVTGLAAGVTEVMVRARDSDGMLTEAGPVRILATNALLLQLARGAYVGREQEGVVTLKLRRNALGPCAVDVVTEDGSARAVGARGTGQYYPLSTTVQFAPNDYETNISVRLVDNLIYQGNRSFVVRLLNPPPGWSLQNPAEALVTILDDDPASQTNLWTEMLAPQPAASARGSLQVRLEPPEALGRWRFLWETRWHADGEAVSGLMPGHYATVFEPRAGFLAPELATNVIAPGAVESVAEHYLAVGRESGGLSMTLWPGAAVLGPERAQWRLQGGATEPWQESGAVLNGLPAGVHLVEFRPVPGFSTPDPQMVPVLGHQTLVRKANYLLAAAAVGQPMEPVQGFESLADGLTNGWPLAFAGHLFSDAGSASGFVVKPRTVLTAAHAIFNGASLSYVDRVWWFFQMHRGEHEPVPNSPRGSYLFAGYAAARTNDLLAGLGAGESSVDSLSLDVAALYFFEDAGRGGYGGYLVSDSSRDWLLGPEPKMVLSYPVQGVPEEQQGRLHLAGPARLEFANAVEGLDYTEAVRVYPGGSGGPVCVLWTNSLGRPFFFPAAVQLGGSGRLAVRLIDLDVADLIGRAEQSSNGGGNSTGGGIISVVAGGAGAGRRGGLLSVRVGPPAAVRLGGAWRISPTNYGELGELRDNTSFTAAVTTLAVLSTNLSLEVKPLAGLTAPTNELIRVVEDANVLLDLSYSVVPPQFISHPQFGLGLLGTPGTCYRIETKAEQESDARWLPLQKVALEPGTNWVSGPTPSESTGRVYRAVWLSE